MSEFKEMCEGYSPPANDLVWNYCQHAVDGVPPLKQHRDWVEKNAWGFGDRAFHYMWYLLLRDEVLLRPRPKLLEVGVYKGQVISLWSLISGILNVPSPQITAVSPFGSDYRRGGRILARLFSRKYREDMIVGNVFPSGDYFACVQKIFDQFRLDINAVRFIHGYSQDRPVIERLYDGGCFDVIYIDGGHRYDQVVADLAIYPRMVALGGYLVLDDASVFQPGSMFWKGIENVSRAVEEWGAPGFKNVLNVGHNRIFQRI